MIKSFPHFLFAITVLVSFVACEKSGDVDANETAEQASPKAQVDVEEVKEDLKEIAAYAHSEAKEVIATVKEKGAKNLEVAKEKLAEVKAEASEEMTELVEMADRELEEAGAALKSAKEDAAESLNQFLQKESAVETDQ